MKNCLQYSVLLLLVGLISCNLQKSEYKVGFLLPSLKTKRWLKESGYFEEKIKEYGGTVIIKDAERDESKQYQQALQLIDEGVDLIVIISVNANITTAIVRNAHAKGIKVLAYDGMIKNCDLDFFVTFDGEKVGELIAKYMIERVPEGNYVLLNGDKGDDNAVLFQNGVLKALQPSLDSKKINLIYSGYMEEWSGANAAFYTDKILEYGNVEINAILSTYDGLSDGIASALKSRNLTQKIPITGQDAEIAACYRIMHDQQAMTVYKSGKSLAYKCAEMVQKILKNETISDLRYINNGRKDVPSIILDPIAVDKNNLESTVVADGYLSMDEILNYSDH